ncbi:glycosyltransferase family 2 protein [Halorubrum tibetense]|uniref:Glycosyltransferase family 2 protein n=1 Tax=Halorubrum tibetense TaxID=175631 RepID=A0ABD5S6Y1_9EURY
MTVNDLASVVIRTYYRNRLLRRAIESTLEQTYDKIEVIVVDDSGVAHAKEVVAEYDDVRYIAHNENKGPIEPWHTGYAEARGEYIQLLDDDDWIEPKKIEKQIKKLDSEDCGVVFCNIYETDADKVVKPNYNVSEEFQRSLLSFESYPCQTTSMLIRSDALDNVLPLKAYSGGADIVLQIELNSQTKFCHLDSVLVNRPTAGETLGSSPEAYKAHLQILEDYEYLYKSYSSEFKNKVIASRWEKLGRSYLRESYWTHLAVFAFANAFYSYPGFSFYYFQLLLASLFGRVGLHFGGILKGAGRLFKLLS